MANQRQRTDVCSGELGHGYILLEQRRGIRRTILRRRESSVVRPVAGLSGNSTLAASGRENERGATMWPRRHKPVMRGDLRRLHMQQLAQVAQEFFFLVRLTEEHFDA